MRHLLLLCLCTLVLSSCYRTQLHTNQARRGPAPGYDNRWHHGAFWGLVNISGAHAVDQVCPHGLAQISSETSFWNGLIRTLTLGLYTPQTVTIYCAEQTAGGPPAESAPPAEAGPPDLPVESVTEPPPPR